MPLNKAGANILSGIETAHDWRTAQNLAGYKVGGAAISAATTTSGYLYSGETFTPTGYKKGGQQIVFQKSGCRPRTGTAIWTSGSAGTAYIHRYSSDGSVRVTGSTAHDGSGVNIAPVVGLRYLMALLWGGGGGGGKGGLAVTSSGGGGGAVAACCIRLPENGYATLVVGGAGSGATATLGTGGNGGASSITSGNFSCTCNGGGGGEYGSGGGGGGGISVSGSDGVYIAGANGNGRNNKSPGAAAYVTYTDYCPENTSIGFAGAGGGSGGGAGYGNGGNGGSGGVYLYY